MPAKPPYDATPIWAVVPVKRLDLAKRRLSPLLTNAQRARLAETMLGDLMQTLFALKELTGVAIISNDPAVRSISRGRAVVLQDETESGTNCAIAQAIRHFDTHHRDCTLVVLPGDVPFTTQAEVKSVLAGLQRDAVVIVPDRHGTGTNLMAGRRLACITTHFGPGSHRRHMASIAAAGLQPRSLCLPGLSWDIDTPADLELSLRLEHGDAGRSTVALLHEIRNGLLRPRRWARPSSPLHPA